MKIFFSIILFLALAINLCGQSLDWNWTIPFQRLENERSIFPKQLFVDKENNSYVVAIRRASILVDGDSLAFPDQVQQPAVYFVSKFNVNGQNIWTKGFDSEYRDLSIDVDINNKLHVFYRAEKEDRQQGYAFIHQTFNNSQDSVITVDTILIHDRSFIPRLGARNKFHIDKDLNTYFFVNNIGEDQIRIMGIDTTIEINSEASLSILKYNIDGQLLWRQQIDSDEIEAFHFAINDQNELSLAGEFTEFLVVEGDTLVGETSNASDVFCLQFSPDGSLKWKRKFGLRISNEYINQVQVKGQDIYLTGTIDFGTQTFDQFTIEVSRFDPYLLKLNAADGSVQDVINLPIYAAGRTFTIDDEDNIFLLGEYNGYPNVLGPDTLPNTSGILLPDNIYIAAIEQTDGFKIKNGFAITGQQDLSVLSARWTGQNSISILGNYEWDINIGEKTLVANYLDVLGVYDMYLANFSLDLALSINVLDEKNPFSIFPNPSRGNFNIQKSADFSFNQNASYTIYNLEGKKVSTGVFTNQTLQIQETIRGKGLYILEVVADQKVYVQRIVVH